MAAEAWLTRGAAALWERAGGSLPFPRHLDRLLPYGLQTRVVSVRRLTLGVVAAHVRRMGLPEVPAEPDRRLRGCLVVGHACRRVFVDADDPEEERRLTLAHETAHLWLEVIEPRDRVQDYLGEQALEVLDGIREPTHAERLHATLRCLSLRRPFHLLERDPEHGILHESVRRAEDRADRLALELLAPEEEALRRLPPAGPPYSEWLEQAGSVLAEEFGLPTQPAHRYAQRLAAAVGARPSFWDRWYG